MRVCAACCVLYPPCASSQVLLGKETKMACETVRRTTMKVVTAYQIVLMFAMKTHPWVLMLWGMPAAAATLLYLQVCSAAAHAAVVTATSRRRHGDVMAQARDAASPRCTLTHLGSHAVARCI